MLPLESVPNFSEGRDAAAIDAIGDALAAHARCSTSTPTPTTTAPSSRSSAPSGARKTRSSRASAVAKERIDLRRHEGVHPRVGAADVVPIVALRPEDMARREAGGARCSRSGSTAELGLPVFLYGEVGEGRGPAFFRRGGTEELQRRLDAGELAPDFGPPWLDPAAGAVLVGARRPLIAFNVNLRGERRGGSRDRGAGPGDAAAASPACGRSASTFRRRAMPRSSMNVEDWEAARAARDRRADRRRGGAARGRGDGLGARRPDARGRRGAGRRRGAADRAVRRVARARAAAARPLRPRSARLDSLAMAQRTAVALTGDDLVAEHVWEVAVDGAPVALSEVALAERVNAARALVEEAAHGAQEHTYGINTGLRPLRRRSDPAGAHRRAPAAPAAQPRVRRGGAVSATRSCARDAAAREHAREGLLGRPRRDRRAPRRVPQPGRAAATSRARGSVGASGDLAPLAHLALPLVGEGEAWFDGELLAGRGRARASRARADPLEAKEGLSLDQRHAVHGRDRRARRRSRAAARRRPPTSPARCRSRRCRARATSFLPQIHALRRLAGQARRRSKRAPPARGLGDHRGAPLVRQGAGRVLAPLRAAGARRGARPARLRRRDGRRRGQRGHGQPARARRRRDARLERELPRPAARVRARRARDGGRRAREHLRAARRAARQPEPLGRAARVPRDTTAASTRGS